MVHHWCNGESDITVEPSPSLELKIYDTNLH